MPGRLLLRHHDETQTFKQVLTMITLYGSEWMTHRKSQVNIVLIKKESQIR